MTGISQGAQVEELVEGPAGLLALGRAPGCADDGSGCMPQPATALWTSVDGASWSRVDLRKAFGGAAVGDVSAGPKGYMAVSLSSDAGTAAPAVWLSADGQSWRAVSLSAATFQDAYLASGTVLGYGFLVAGRIGSLAGWDGGEFPSTTPAIWWSADGAAWSRVTLANAAAAPQAQAAITTLAARRFRSHSHGPGNVSSKSATSKIGVRSGAAKTPKFMMCASPQSCTRSPEEGVAARSAAIVRAAPRKKVKGETDMRPQRMGTSSGRRRASWARSWAMGSGLSPGGSQPAWVLRGTAPRAALPMA